MRLVFFLGTALLLGANAVKADETSTASTKTPEVTNSDKQKPDSAITTPVVEELPELKIDAVKADEKPSKEDAKTGSKTCSRKEVTVKAATENLVKSKLTKEVAKEKLTKKHLKSCNRKKAATEEAQDEVKTVLTQLTSEADVMGTVASNFSDKEVKDAEAKQNCQLQLLQ